MFNQKQNKTNNGVSFPGITLKIFINQKIRGRKNRAKGLKDDCYFYNIVPCSKRSLIIF